MKNLTLVLFLTFKQILFSQVPTIEWQKCIGGSGNDNARALEQTSDGGYIIAGNSETSDGDIESNQGLKDLLISKINSNGNIEWKKSLGGSYHDGASSIKQTSDGGYIVAGYTGSNNGDILTGNQGLKDVWILKLNSTGNIEWQKTYGGSANDGANSIIQTNDGGYIITGYTESNDGDVVGIHGNNSEDIWILKINSNGIIEWQKCLGSNGIELSSSIEQTTDDGYIVAGVTSGINGGDVSDNHGQWDAWIVKINSTGVIEWQKCLGGSWHDYSYNIKQTIDGGFIVAGTTTSTDGDAVGNDGGSDCWVIKLNLLGNIEWQKSYGGIGNEYINSINQTLDGGYIISGKSDYENGDVVGINYSMYGTSDIWIIKINSSGIIEWQKCIGGTDSEFSADFQETNDGGYIIVGNTLSNNIDVNGNHSLNFEDIWIVKLSAEVGLFEEQISSVISIYPNPTEGVLQIKNIPLESKIQIQDVNGRVIYSQFCANEIVNVDFSNYTSKGVYFVHILNSNDEVVDIQKVVLQ
jgi:hypothetical protein